MRSTDYTTMSPAELLAVVARDGADCEAAKVAASLMRPPQPPPTLRCSAEAYRRILPEFAPLEHERFAVVALDARNRIIALHTVAQGSLSSCVVHPRDVFRPLLTGRKPPAACILAHNHPSGDPAPSPEDERLTERLVDAGRLLGVPVMDHLIIGSEGYFSFRDNGKLGAAERE